MAPHGKPTSEVTRARRLYPAWDQGHGQGQNWWVHMRPSNQSIGLFFIWRKSAIFATEYQIQYLRIQGQGHGQNRSSILTKNEKKSEKDPKRKKWKDQKSSLSVTLCSWPLTWPWKVNQLGALNYYQHACEIGVQPVQDFWSYCPHTI